MKKKTNAPFGVTYWARFEGGHRVAVYKHLITDIDRGVHWFRSIHGRPGDVSLGLYQLGRGVTFKPFCLDDQAYRELMNAGL